ncbi:hypothetical protein AAHB45_09050 [Pediococcus pentosaceus]|uniref:hypothetical protein n=1 Tax=Pediococcus pentosaceus TaxID=1255 RepID=UPI00316AA286
MKNTLELLIVMSSTICALICALSIAALICSPFLDFDFKTMQVLVMAFSGGLLGLVVSFQLTTVISSLPDNFDSKNFEKNKKIKK